MNTETFDTVIVGSGSSAYFAAQVLTQAGQKIAMVDERPYGGTCALRGCQPKKYLVANVDAVAMACHLVGQGIIERPQTDWKALQKLKNEFLDGLSEEAQAGFEKWGVKTYLGSARMTGAHTIEVNEQRLEGEHIILATGSAPRPMSIPGADLAGTSDDFLNLADLPERMVFIGGGYISMEFATVAAYAGVQVTLLHRSKQILKNFDQDCVSVLLDAAKEIGINIVTEESPEMIEKTASGYVLKGSSGKEYETDYIINATGRIPNTSVLSKGKNHNVDFDGRGIKVKPTLQSVSNPAVYSIGDVADSGYQLAPVADHEGKLAASNLLAGNPQEIDYRIVPSTVFTIPNLATVGLSEEEVKAKNILYRVNRGSTAGWPSSKRIGEKHSFYKVIIEEGTNRILGAHLVRHLASELINLFALAIAQEVTTEAMQKMMWAYPTYSSDIKYMIK
ncbi:MAG: NAD(P)/FAD-dependent oxidoreductase [Verrucomicrobiota bacterium]